MTSPTPNQWSRNNDVHDDGNSVMFKITQSGVSTLKRQWQNAH